MSNAIEMLKNNDTGLLRPDQIEDFRAYLVDTGCKVRKGNNHGQLLFVGTSAGWAPLQKGANDTVKTPYALRSVINDFLKTPMARSLSLHKRISQSKSIPLNADLARIAAAAVTAQPAAVPMVADLPCDELAESPTGSHTHEISISGPGHHFSSNLLPRSEGDHIHSLTLTDRRIGEPQTCAVGTMYHDPSARYTPEGSTAERPANFHVLPVGASPDTLASQRAHMHNENARHLQWAAFGEMVKRLEDEGEPESPHILLSPRLREMALKGGLMIAQCPQYIYDGAVASKPAADPLHLEDLRDDFAIHCPLTPLEDESPAAFADRRWAYADLMMQKRSPQYAD
jgi:hypothetical protein